jgi:hypothetical protein
MDRFLDKHRPGTEYKHATTNSSSVATGGHAINTMTPYKGFPTGDRIREATTSARHRWDAEDGRLPLGLDCIFFFF